MKFLFSIALLVIAGAVFFTFVNPQYAAVKKLRADVETYNVAINNSNELQGVRDSLVETYKNIDPKDKSRLEHFLPNSVNNIRFILEVEQIANLHNMPLKNIKFEPPQKAKDPKTGAAIASNDPLAAQAYGVFPLEFTTEGTYETFSLFLKDLEQNLRLINVKSISFSVPDQSVKPLPGVNPNVYTFQLKVETYWLK